MDVSTMQVEDDVMDCAQQVIDAFLLSHYADIADQIPPAALEPLVLRTNPHALQTGPASHGEHALRRPSASFHGDTTVGLIGCNRYVGGAECPAFQFRSEEHRVGK